MRSKEALFRVERTGDNSVGGHFTKGEIYLVLEVDEEGDYKLLDNYGKPFVDYASMFEKVEVSTGYAVKVQSLVCEGKHLGYRFNAMTGTPYGIFDLSLEAVRKLGLRLENYPAGVIELREDKKRGIYVSGHEAKNRKAYPDLSDRLDIAAEELRIKLK